MALATITANEETSLLTQPFLNLVIHFINRTPISGRPLLIEDLNSELMAEVVEPYTSEEERKAFNFDAPIAPDFVDHNGKTRMLSQPFTLLLNEVMKLENEDNRADIMTSLENALRHVWLPILTDEEIKSFSIKSFTRHEEF